MLDFLVIQSLNGMVYSMLLFLLALGLSLTFGMLRVVNLAHGSFFLLGAYAGLTMWVLSKSIWLSVTVGTLAVALVGAVVERVFLERFYKRSDLDQVILTFGFALVISDVMKMIWGKDIRSLPPPINGAIEISGILFPQYRLFLILIGVVLFGLTWLSIERTRIGAIIRAAVADRIMVSGLGFDLRFLFTAVFAFGTGIAALAGILGAPITSVYPGLDFEILITTLIVVVVGGLGSISGVFWASILIGMTDTFGKAVYPAAASFSTFTMMALVLLIRSHGHDEEELE